MIVFDTEMPLMNATRTSTPSYSSTNLNSYRGLKNDSWGSISNTSALQSHIGEYIFFEVNVSDTSRLARYILKLNSISGTTIYTDNIGWGYEGSAEWNWSIGKVPSEYEDVRPITSIVYQGVSLTRVIFGSAVVWDSVVTTSIILKKNTGVSSISLTYINASGSSVTVSTAGTYAAKQGTSYSWTASPSAPYNISSSSGSGTVGSSTITVAPTTTVKTYTLTLTTSVAADMAEFHRVSSPYGGGSVGPLSSGATLYYGDTYYAKAGIGNTYYKDYKASSWSLTSGGVSQTATNTYYQLRAGTTGYSASTSTGTGCGAYKQWGSSSSPLTVTANINVIGGSTAKSWVQVWSGNISWGGIRDSGATRTGYFDDETTSRLFIPSHVRINENVQLQSTYSSATTNLVTVSQTWNIKHAGISGTATTSQASNGDIHGKTLKVTKKAGLYYFTYTAYKVEVYK